MTDRALTNAKKRRDDIAAKINKLVQELEDSRRELVAAEAFIKEWYRFAAAPSDTDMDTHDNSGYPQDHTQDFFPPPMVTQTPKNPERTEVGKRAAQIITELGHPVKRHELFEELQSRGLEIYGKDPEMVLSTMMWRMRDQFVRLPRAGYWLRAQPYEPANYVPGTVGDDQGEEAEISETDREPDPEAELARLIGQNPFGSKK